ncbi:MAG: hydantoinase/oxoprolinase family protein [Steroidobacteraceae bacterium]
MRAGWEFWIDRGGTFTDVIGVAPDGRLVLDKVPSAEPAAGSTGSGSGSDPAVDPGVAAALRMLAAAGAPATDVAAFKVGTTVATNALLERRGSRVLLVTTRGFGDALAIGQQDRPDIFALQIVRPQPLYAEVLEVDERLAVDGRVLRAPDLAAVRAGLGQALARGCDSVAIVLLHGWRHGSHETAVASVARELGFRHVAVSHELAPLERLVPRGDTTVFDAYLGPVLRHFVQRLEAQVAARAPHAALHFMQSSGGLTRAAGFRAAASVLSGPAGGLTAMARLGERLGIGRLIGFDMGGTSTDVSLWDGAFERRFEHRIGGARLATPMLDIHTIAAGGGSLLALRDGRCQAGPQSAGADPGPACYGRGGPATLTDVQVVLGRLSAATMPRLFARTRRRPDRHAAQRARGERRGRGGLPAGRDRLDGRTRSATAAPGLRPRGLHAVRLGRRRRPRCRVAEACGMQRVLVHPLASVLSAWGIGVATGSRYFYGSLGRPLDEAGWAEASRRCCRRSSSRRAALAAQGTPCGPGDAR